MLARADWLDLARELDWELSYVDERQAFPPQAAGTPWLPATAWAGCDERGGTAYSEYVANRAADVRDAIGADGLAELDRVSLAALELHLAMVPLPRFAAAIGNLRAARFGRTAAWRSSALLGALDEIRHTQIPLLLAHELGCADPKLEWTHKLFHSNNWVAIAGRHLVDELLLAANPIELAIGTKVFAGVAAMARRIGDRMLEKIAQSIPDEAPELAGPVLDVVMQHDPAYAQYLVDKWFWRSWQFFAIVTGFAVDYLTPLADRTASFKELVEESLVDRLARGLADAGLAKPWYWDQFLEAIEIYHHMAYASVYTYRATVWFDVALPGPDERAWLRAKYPRTWHHVDPVWERIAARWRAAPTVEWFTHGAAPVGFCNLCQLVLCGGTPARNTARVHVRGDRKYMFCSDPCEWIFTREPERYAGHKDLVQRILAGEAPANLIELLRHMGLTRHDRGRDVRGGNYPWLERG